MQFSVVPTHKDHQPYSSKQAKSVTSEHLKGYCMSKFQIETLHGNFSSYSCKESQALSISAVHSSQTHLPIFPTLSDSEVRLCATRTSFLGPSLPNCPFGPSGYRTSSTP